MSGTKVECEHVRLVRREPAHQGVRRSISGRLFVGSYNLDPRSTWLNCEQGVLVENESARIAARGHFRDPGLWAAGVEGDAEGWRPGVD